jgi:predicted MFS family arabinose efflux permease
MNIVSGSSLPLKALLSNFGLALLAGTGIMYANISPAIVTAYAQNPHFTAEEAGYLISINMSGCALGALITSFYLNRFNWFHFSILLLIILIVSDLVSIWLNQPFSLYSIRFIHGLSAGSLMGIAYAAIARTVYPERIQALSYTFQLLCGGILILIITPRIEFSGSLIVWLPLILFYLLGLLFCPLFKNTGVNKNILVEPGSSASASNLIIALTLAGLFFFQMGQFAAFAYVIELGLNKSFSTEFTGNTVAMGLWIGGPAALFVTWWSLRSGRTLPILVASGVQISSIALLLFPYSTTFIVGNVGWGIGFNIGISYILGLASELDNQGKIATLAAFASTLGLASGPGFAAVIVEGNNYDGVIVASIIILFISITLIIIPAMTLDSKNRTKRMIWT